MSSFYFAINGEPKDLRQSESGSNLNTCAGQRQIVYGAGKFLSGRTEPDDSASVRGDASVLSTISHCRDRSYSARYEARCAVSVSCTTTSGLPGNMYVRVRLQE